jgi:hypothetical protein
MFVCQKLKENCLILLTAHVFVMHSELNDVSIHFPIKIITVDNKYREDIWYHST